VHKNRNWQSSVLFSSSLSRVARSRKNKKRPTNLPKYIIQIF
jgi:hypothetical protein